MEEQAKIEQEKIKQKLDNLKNERDNETKNYLTELNKLKDQHQQKNTSIAKRKRKTNTNIL